MKNKLSIICTRIGCLALAVHSLGSMAQSKETNPSPNIILTRTLEPGITPYPVGSVITVFENGQVKYEFTYPKTNRREDGFLPNLHPDQLTKIKALINSIAGRELEVISPDRPECESEPMIEYHLFQSNSGKTIKFYEVFHCFEAGLLGSDESATWELKTLLDDLKNRAPQSYLNGGKKRRRLSPPSSELN